MATDPTTNYGWDLPDVSADAGSWGTLLNTILDDIDDKLFTADAVADAALPLAGGVMTGHTDLLTQHISGLSLVGGSGTKTIDLATANYWRITTNLAGAVVFDITNIAGYSAGNTDVVAVILQIKAGSLASSITFKLDGTIFVPLWQDGSAPTYAANGKDDIIVLFTYNAGAATPVWIGVHAVASPA